MRKYQYRIGQVDYKYYMDLGAGNDKTQPQAIYRMANGVADVLGGDRKWRISGNVTYKINSGDTYIDRVDEDDIINFMMKDWKLSEIQARNLMTRGNDF